MASNIQIKTDLKDYAPAYNELTVVVREDDNTTRGYPDFQYIFDLYIEGVADFVRFKVRPKPTNDLGIKSFGNILESYVQSYILKDDTLLTGGFQFMDQGIKRYHIEYGNEYRLTTADPIVQYPSLVIGGNKYIWNASLPYNEWLGLNFNNVKNNWLTTQFSGDVAINNVGYAGVISDTDTNIEYIEVKTYDSSNVLINTFQIQNLLSTGVTPSKYMNLITGPKNLNSVTSGLTLGVQPIIDSAVASYTLEVLDGSLASVSDLLTFTMKEQCNYPIKRLHFQNKWGAFDTFNFDLVSKESVNIQKKSYKFNPDRVNASGLLSFDKSDRTNINYHVKSSNQMQLNADWITEEQSAWLEELFTSPEIYLEEFINDGKGIVNLISVAEIQSNKYEIKTDKVERLFNIDLIITFSNDNYRQRR
jgi:hypothetical protein